MEEVLSQIRSAWTNVTELARNLSSPTRDPNYSERKIGANESGHAVRE
jgi:hypothetical protein